MKKVLFLFLTGLIIASCGDDTPVEEPVQLETYEDRLSYVLGAMNAKGIIDSDDPNVDRLDKEQMLEGFKIGMTDSNTDACLTTLQSLFGENGQDFNESYAQEGSKCIGKITATSFYAEMTSLDETKKLVDEKLLIGFEHGLYAADTIVPQADQIKLVDDFFAGIAAKKAEQVAGLETPIWDSIKAIPNIEEIESGVWIETIKKGTGGSPTQLDDVQADYILTSIVGDTMQSSFDRLKSPTEIPAPAFNLSQVYEGWKVSFPHMKKGGKYRIYLPFSAVMDQRLQNQSYSFYIEFIDFGPAGTLAKQQPY